MIRDYLALDLSFATVEHLEQHLRLIHAPFGPLSDEEWQHLARYSARREGEIVRLHYDPNIRQLFERAAEDDIDLWAFYDNISCPCLLLHGAESLILPLEIATQMTERGPKAKLASFQGVGHAPALMAKDQIEVIADFLDL